MKIESLNHHFNVHALCAQLDALDESGDNAWDEHPFRTSNPLSPHREASDIWVRYNSLENFGEKFNDEHESVWYPIADKIPAVKALCEAMQKYIGVDELGGVLITRIPPHGQVYPHTDQGWHATHYQKYAILLSGNKNQAFCFDGIEHRCEKGDSFTFDNQYTHWVTNPTEFVRETLIICMRKH